MISSLKMDQDLMTKHPLVVPIVTLWDMIPSKDDAQDSVPELVSEKGGDTPVLPGPMLKQSVVVDPSPSELLDLSNPLALDAPLNDCASDKKAGQCRA